MIIATSAKERGLAARRKERLVQQLGEEANPNMFDLVRH
jgi:hypothetical protein